MNIAGLVKSIVYYAFVLMLGILVVYLLLQLFNASTNSAFVSFIYGLAGPLIAPFRGMFPGGGLVSGVSAVAIIVAIVVYGIMGYVIYSIISKFFSGGTQTSY